MAHSWIRGLDEVVGRIFRLNRLLCLFPFVVSGTNLRISYKLLLLSSIVVLFLSGGTVLLLEEPMKVFIIVHDDNLRRFSFILPLVLIEMIPSSNLVWLLYNKNKLNKIFKTIRQLELLTGHTTPQQNLFLFSSIVTVIFINFAVHFYVLSDHKKYHIYIAIMFELSTLMSYSVITQYDSLMRMALSHYQNILNKLDNSLERWFLYGKNLGECCRNIKDCYALQLALMITTNFMSLICFIHQTVKPIFKSKKFFLTSWFGIWAALHFLVAWYIILLCDTARTTAKKFDNMVYYMIMNDPTKTLVKNKRIIIHFKANRKEEFSAMGFFNFDYPLLCSMVSSATTYIVILIQFS
ncbi:Gustatory receptor 90a [Halyomorpha halys]|nr:Gustatory receptor 90a [Halyomorpha halys]